MPTQRGAGICDAKRKIQIDRYSTTSNEGLAVPHLDPANTFAGWKVALTEKDAFVQYDRVEFGERALKSAIIRTQSSAGGTIELRLDKSNGHILARVQIPASDEWKEIAANLTTISSGLHNLVGTLPETSNVEIGWGSFE